MNESDAPASRASGNLLGERAREIALLCLILVVASAVHVVALNRPFFADDYFFLEQVRGHSLLAALSSPDPLGNFLRPVSRQAYFWMLSRVGNESPIVFHLAGLFMFLGCLVLFNRLVRRLAGPLPALTATGLFAFSCAFDVPLRWASGSQDLMAVLFGVLAIYLHLSGKRVLAAVCLLLGLLSKEVIALAFAVAIFADHRAGERWQAPIRRGWALMLATAIWAAWWVLSIKSRPASGQSLSLAPQDLVAAIVHYVQVAAALEFRGGGDPFGHWRAAAVFTGLIAGALIWMATGKAATESRPPARPPARPPCNSCA